MSCGKASCAKKSCGKFRAVASLATLAVALLASHGSARADDAQLRVEQVEARILDILQHGLWGGETGDWRTKTQLVVDPVTRRLVRKTFTIWDPAPSRNRDFTWVPDAMPGAGEIVSGHGRLIWRRRDLPSYDTRSIVGIYRGDMQNGRPSGQGEYTDVDDVLYAGAWVDGHAQGTGHLKLPNGDEYEGAFVAGRPQGDGHYVDATGEVYQGTFVGGRREGRATTTLPSGASYQSEWRGGVELPSSRYVRLAQAPGGPSPGGQANDDVRIGILVNPLSPRIFRSEEIDTKTFVEQALGYVADNTDKRLEIRPGNSRLMGMWKGDTEIQLTSREEEVEYILMPEVSYGVFSYAKILLPPVDVTVEVQNRATRSIQITNAYLDVAQSVTDKQPAVQISIGNDNYCADTRYHRSYSPKLTFENYGWGRAQNARIRYSFIDPSSNAIPANLSETKTIGNIEKTAAVSFESDLKALSVDTNRLAAKSCPPRTRGSPPCSDGFKCDSVNGKLDEKACLSQLGGASLFGSLANKVRISGVGPYANDDAGNIVTTVAGVLEYDWTDAAGKVQNRVSPFRQRLWLGRINFGAECGDGASVKRPAQSPLEFKLDQSGYRISVPIKEAVPAGRTARYALLLNAARSSQHDFVVALQLADGRTIRSRPINLTYFYPAWFADPKFRP
jgi:hypothetical protein